MLDVKDLNIEFHDHLVPETVVHQVSFHMDAGEIVGLVGESGSGKSMTALAIAGLLSRHDMKKTGEILFEGTDLLHCERSFLRELQGNDISVVFQEPMTSLNPVYRNAKGSPGGAVERSETEGLQIGGAGKNG